MPLKQYQSKMIALFVHQELLLAELYGLFANYFPEYRDFWETISHDEMEHAEWIEYFAQKIPNGDMDFFEDRVRTHTIQAFVSYVQKIISHVKAIKPPIEMAFSLARDIEKALLEKDVFTHFRAMSPELRSLMTRLNEKTEGHFILAQKKASELRLAGVPF